MLEDDILYCSFLRRWLESQGYSVFEAWNLEEFKTVLEDEDPDAAILDLTVPESPSTTGPYLVRGGVDAAKIIASGDRALQADGVIIVSMTLDETSVEMLEAIGVAHHFQKPFQISDLERAVREATSATRKRRNE